MACVAPKGGPMESFCHRASARASASGSAPMSEASRHPDSPSARSLFGWLWTLRRQLVLAVLSIASSLLTPAAVAGTAMYYYELGRPIETVAADGTSVQYRYEAVGNILS